MKVVFERANRILAAPLEPGPRGLLILAALLLSLAYVAPLWNLTMLAPQHPDGLRLSVYSYKLAGGNDGRDIREINGLLHFLGTRDLAEANFSEFQWIPFVVGAVGLLLLRCAVLGNMSTIVDLLVLFAYFGLFSLWSFGYKLHEYGRSLAATAAGSAPPFAPPIFGHKAAGGFEVFSFPGPGAYALLAAFLLVAAAAWLARREAREGLAAEARAAG